MIRKIMGGNEIGFHRNQVIEAWKYNISNMNNKIFTGQKHEKFICYLVLEIFYLYCYRAYLILTGRLT